MNRNSKEISTDLLPRVPYGLSHTAKITFQKPAYCAHTPRIVPDE
jgi:hypothetical protein